LFVHQLYQTPAVVSVWIDAVFCLRINFTKLRLPPPFGLMKVFCLRINFTKLRLSPPFGLMRWARHAITYAVRIAPERTHPCDAGTAAPAKNGFPFSLIILRRE
jgi:hypothetical protein